MTIEKRSHLDDDIDTVLDHKDVILANKEKIEMVFQSTVESNKVFNNFDAFSQNFLVAFPMEDEEEIGELLNSFVTIVVNLNKELQQELLESAEEDLVVEFISELSLKYSTDLLSRINRIYKGTDWWSNIKTNIGVRSNRAHFEHELTIDYDRQIEFNSDIDSSLTLAHHFLNQVESAPGIIGEDLLAGLNKQQVEAIKETTESLLDDLEEYEEMYEEENAPEDNHE